MSVCEGEENMCEGEGNKHMRTGRGKQKCENRERKIMPSHCV